MTDGQTDRHRTTAKTALTQRHAVKMKLRVLQHYTYNDNDNDNDKRLGLTAKADQPDHKKYNTAKIKMGNEAVQKLQTS